MHSIVHSVWRADGDILDVSGAATRIVIQRPSVLTLVSPCCGQRRHGKQDKSKDDGLSGGKTPLAQRTVSAEGGTARDSGGHRRSQPTSGQY